jgi:hypothetical protein
MNKEIEIPEGYEAKIEDNKVIFVPKESEDEMILEAMIFRLGELSEMWFENIFCKQFTKAQILAYLEKQKEQKPAEWSEIDRNYLNSVINLVHDTPDGAWGSCVGDTIERWLRTLPERFNLQPKAEWSEEDELFLGVCKNALSKYERSDKWDANIISVWLENRLKSLRPRPNWKPSEDEVRLINTSISFLKDFADKGYENAVECIDWLKSKLNGDSGK